jgi:hypothetical protein
LAPSSLIAGFNNSNNNNSKQQQHNLYSTLDEIKLAIMGLKLKVRHGISSAMVLLVLLQIYQVCWHVIDDSSLDEFNLDSSIRRTTTTSAAIGSWGPPAPGSSSPRSKSHGNTISSNTTINASNNNNIDKEEGFSACLMIMDDNAHLIEWLAYHYQMLPLRRLIVAVDPRSETSPHEILQRWQQTHHAAGDINTNTNMEITTWSDVDFMPPHKMDAHKKIPDWQTKLITELHRERQEHFYARCMARLHYEGKGWTALFDTDEYILANHNAQGEHAIVPRGGGGGNRQQETILELIHKAHKENELFGKKLDESPCIPMARLRFGVLESSTSEQEAAAAASSGFTANDFQTLRWRHHAGRGAKNINKIGKAMIDLSRVDSDLFLPTLQVMVHLPIKEYCNGEDLWLLNAYSPFIMHHYGGTWEQWSHRKDSRGTRTRENYDKMAYHKGTDDNIRPWLSQFVRHVGYAVAKDLLRGVGQVERR